MKTRSIDEISLTSQVSRQWNPDWCRSAVHRLLSEMTGGRLVLEEQGEIFEFGQEADTAELVAHVYVHDAMAYRYVLLNGSVGAAESYMAGDWESPDTVAVVRLFVRNMSTLLKMDQQQSLWQRLGTRLLHRFRRNSVDGSRRNISAHYDVGNDFFSLFLDPHMMYSSAIFPHSSATLEQASSYKLEHICQRLQLQASDHLLEIGSGWGGLAIYAAQHYGCKVTTTTISREQFDYASRRVQREGLQDRVTVLCQDYRSLSGQFDKLVSVEMIEAVGHQYYPRLFQCFDHLLKDDGLMLLQAITISDQRFDRARRSVDFIQKYIFPGGCLPSMAVIANQFAVNTRLQVVAVEDITSHYATTIHHWRSRFWQQIEQVKQQGYQDTFIRMWDYYLAYCEGGFEERVISTVQVLAAKPRFRQLPAISH